MILKILKYELPHIIKNFRYLTFLLLTLITLFVINALYYKASQLDQSRQKLPQFSSRTFESVYRASVVSYYRNSTELRKNILKTDPILTLLFFFLTSIMPVFLIFLFYPNISGEISNNSFFCFIQYTGKTKYFLAKLSAALISILPVLLLLVWISYAINANRTIPVDNADQVPKAIRLSLLVIPYLITMTSVIFMISTITRSTYGSLSLSLILYYVLYIIEHTSLAFLSPTYFNDWIFYGDPVNILLFLGATLLFTALFNAVSILYLKKRNLQ